MKSYLLIDMVIRDLPGFMAYAERIPALIAKHSGRYIVQGEVPTLIDGAAPAPERTVVIEFPTRAAAEAFLAERAASDLHLIWANTTTSRILLVDGCT